MKVKCKVESIQHFTTTDHYTFIHTFINKEFLLRKFFGFIYFQMIRFMLAILQIFWVHTRWDYLISDQVFTHQKSSWASSQYEPMCSHVSFFNHRLLLWQNILKDGSYQKTVPVQNQTQHNGGRRADWINEDRIRSTEI